MMRIGLYVTTLVGCLVCACGSDSGSSSANTVDASVVRDAGSTGQTSDSGPASSEAGLPNSDAGIPPLPPGPNRFEGKSEQEMFVTVRDALCGMVIRCPLLIGDPPPTDYSLEKCRGGFNDMSAYKKAINEESRGRIAQCLEALEKAKCDDLLDAWPAVCELVEQYTDLS